ncbi:MAG: nucleotide exchange factor GrpE [Bacteroidetes bacterium]|nr:nucleotide exchange factor GrpE [Bacteroidota bacterium]
MKKEKHEIKINGDEQEINNGKENLDNKNLYSNESMHTEKEDKNNLKELSDELAKANQKISQLENEVSDYKDKLLRKAAEFENYKRRTENEQLNLLKYAAESFIVKLLPIVDDFERSLLHLDNAKDVDSIKQGIKLVYDKLIKILTDQGVTKIDSVGKPFDVHFHEALMQRKAEGVKPHTVLDEVEKGYIYKDRVIRHAKVVVSEDSMEETTNQSDIDYKNNSEGK